MRKDDSQSAVSRMDWPYGSPKSYSHLQQANRVAVDPVPPYMRNSLVVGAV